MDLSTKVWLANEIRIWGLAVTAIVGIISFAATWTHSRWQAELSTQKEDAARIVQRESNERIAEAQARAAEANQKAESERLERIKIEERLADRTLSDTQYASVVAKVKEYEGQEYEVTTYWNSREPMAISNRISHALTLAGWRLVQPTSGQFLLGGLEGVEIYYHPQADARNIEAAKSIAAALKAEGIVTSLHEKNAPNNPDNKVTFNVGTKPQ